LRYRKMFGQKRIALNAKEALDIYSQLAMLRGSFVERCNKSAFGHVGICMTVGWGDGKSLWELFDRFYGGAVEDLNRELAGLPSLAELMTAQYQAELNLEYQQAVEEQYAR
jgi:hypothetical protein